MAPKTRRTSRPRLMRPAFSVMHSPKLTNRNGVLTRMAPPSSASRRPPQVMSAIGMLLFPAFESVAERFEGEQAHEQRTLQRQGRRIGQIQMPLQQTAAGADAADQYRADDNRQRIVARGEGHE